MLHYKLNYTVELRVKKHETMLKTPANVMSKKGAIVNEDIPYLVDFNCLTLMVDFYKQ